jgi:hypothetical protein
MHISGVIFRALVLETKPVQREGGSYLRVVGRFRDSQASTAEKPGTRRNRATCLNSVGTFHTEAFQCDGTPAIRLYSY